jgi:hypothetical protein
VKHGRFDFAQRPEVLKFGFCVFWCVKIPRLGDCVVLACIKGSFIQAWVRLYRGLCFEIDNYVLTDNKKINENEIENMQHGFISLCTWG